MIFQFISDIYKLFITFWAGEVIGSALPASPGAAAGKVYFTAEEAKAAGEKGERVILLFITFW